MSNYEASKNEKTSTMSNYEVKCVFSDLLLLKLGEKNASKKR